MKIEPISLTFSGIALLLSLTTAWFTLWRRGRIRMTRPSLIFFGPDGSGGPMQVFVRAFMYSTSDRGRIVDQMFARLHHRLGVRSFTSWIVRDGSLSRGAGLLVDRRGVAHDHHFVLADGRDVFTFQEGDYLLEIFGTCVGKKHSILLTSQAVHVSGQQAESLNHPDFGLFFDWDPEKSEYHSHLDRNPTVELKATFHEAVQFQSNVQARLPLDDHERNRA